MPNQFVARKGLIALDDSQITGSLSVSGSTTLNAGLEVHSGNSSMYFEEGASVNSNDGKIYIESTGGPSNIALNRTDGAQLALITGQSFAGFYYSNNKKFGIQPMSNPASATSFPSVTSLVLDGSGNIGIGTDSPTTTLDVRGDTVITGSNSLAGSYALKVANSSGTDLITAENDGTVELNDKVFINGTNILPLSGYALNVSESVNIRGVINFDNSSHQAWIKTANSTQRAIKIPGTGGHGYFQFYNTNGNGIQLFNSSLASNSSLTLRTPSTTGNNPLMQVSVGTSIGNPQSGGGSFIYYDISSNPRTYTFGNPGSEGVAGLDGTNVKLTASPNGGGGGARKGGNVYIISTPGSNGGIDGKVYITGSTEITGSLNVIGDITGSNISASTYYGDGSNLTGIDSGSWDGVFTGSAEITGSLEVKGDTYIDGFITASDTIWSQNSGGIAFKLNGGTAVRNTGRFYLDAHDQFTIRPDLDGGGNKFVTIVGDLLLSNNSNGVPQDRLHVDGGTVITGSNSLAGSYALKVANSSGTDLITAENDGTVVIGTNSNYKLTVDNNISKFGDAFRIDQSSGDRKLYLTNFDIIDTAYSFGIQAVGIDLTSNTINLGGSSKAININKGGSSETSIPNDNGVEMLFKPGQQGHIPQYAILRGTDTALQPIPLYIFGGANTNTTYTSAQTGSVVLQYIPNVGARGNVGIGLNNPQANLHVSGAVSASTYYGDGSNLTGIDSGSWDGVFTGSAEITGSLNVIGDITGSNISASTYYGDGSNLTGISSDPFPYTGSAIISGSLEVTGSIKTTSHLDVGGSGSFYDKNFYIGTNVGSNPSPGFNSTFEFTTGPDTYASQLIFRPGSNQESYNENYWGSIRNIANVGLYVLGGNYNDDVVIGRGAPTSTTNYKFARFNNSGVRIGYSTSLGSAEARFHVDGTTKLNGNTTITGSNSLAGNYALKVANSSGTDILTVENDGKTSLLTPTLNGITTLDTGDIKLEVSESRMGNAKSVVFETFGATGGWKGGYDFRTGYNNSTTTTSAFKIIGNSTTTNSVGVGDFDLNFLESAGAQLVIEKNTLTIGSRNAAIRILNNQSSTDASDDSTYSGIQFDSFNEGAKGGAFIGTQASTYSNGYETDFVILATGVPHTSYSEIARFVGWNKSFYVGENRDVIDSNYKLQVDGAISASTYYGDGSNLTGIDSGSWDGVFTGSAEITGSLDVTGDVSASTYYGDGSNLTGIDTDPFPYTGSAIISGSLEVIGNITGSLSIEGSGSTLFEVNGSEGQLFSITDSLSGSLFAVSDVSGLPILEVFSDDTIKMGSFNAEALEISGSDVNFNNLPTSDPGVAGRLYQTGSDAIGATAGFQVVCISQG